MQTPGASAFSIFRAAVAHDAVSPYHPAMRGLIRPFLDRPALTGIALAMLVLLGLVGDLLQPAFPAVPLLALLAALGLGAGLMLARANPDAPWPHGIMASAALLLAGFLLLAALQYAVGARRGVLGSLSDSIAARQDRAFGEPRHDVAATEELRAALDRPEPAPRPRPATADEFLYNAILLRQRDEPVLAARALAESIRRSADPRPDALLLHDGLMAAGLPGVRDALSALPASLPAPFRGHLEAMALPEGAARIAALTRLVEQDPEALLAAAALARSLIAVSLPHGPTVAVAGRIAALIDAFEDEDRLPAFAARFLHQGAVARLQEEMLALSWTREVSQRRLTLTAVAPPPGQPNAPILLRVEAPEPATSIQFLRGSDAEGAIWAEVAQRAGEPAPTLRVNRPWRVQPMRFRYLDRDGVTAPEVAVTFDPAQVLRDQAQRTLQRQGTFANYAPGRLGGGRLNNFALPGHLRPGLIAVEWATDAERRPRVVPVGVPDEVILAGDPPRVVVEMQAPPQARTLILTAVFADGSRSSPLELPIR
jgi:hypothetical protein